MGVHTTPSLLALFDYKGVFYMNLENRLIEIGYTKEKAVDLINQYSKLDKLNELEAFLNVKEMLKREGELNGRI